MKQDLMEVLACPVCKGELELTVDEEEGDEIMEGSLYCPECDETFPIEEGIPNLLPPDFEE